MAELTLYGLPMYRIGGIGVRRRRGQAAQSQPQVQGDRCGRGRGERAPRRRRRRASPPGSFPTDPVTGLPRRELLRRPHVRQRRRSAAPAARTTRQRRRHRRALPPDRAEGDPPDHDRQRPRRAADGADVERRERIRSRLRAADRRLVGAEPEVQFDDLAFPSKLQAVTTFRRLRTQKQQVVLAQGQFFATNATDGAGTGTQRLFSHEAGTVFSSPSTDFAPPVVHDARRRRSPTGSALVRGRRHRSRRDAAGTVKRVVVALPRDRAVSVWHFLDLVQAAPGSSRWSGSGPLTGTHLQYFVQAVDANGNVGVSTNKGLYYNEVPPPPPPSGGVAVAPTVAVPASGWFNGSVDVQVTVNGATPRRRRRDALDRRRRRRSRTPPRCPCQATAPTPPRHRRPTARPRPRS